MTFNIGAGATAPVTLNHRRIELGVGPQGLQTISNASTQLLTINTDLLDNSPALAGNGSPLVKTLTLGGVGNGVFAGNIRQGADTIRITKAGAGTWTLSGNNTYTGQTLVSAGVLALTGGSTASPVSMSAGASLQFTIGSPVTSSSSFDLNLGSIRISGTPTAASHTLITASSEIIGTPVLAESIPGYELRVEGTSLKLVNPSINSYASWIAGFPSVGALTGFSDDPDNDGLKNGVENFFGTAPDVSNPGIVPGAATGNTFTFTHPQNATPGSDVAAAYRWSKDLTTFNNSGVTDAAGTTVTLTAQPNTPVAGTTTVTATVTGTATPRLFLDLKVTLSGM
jgi:autotransporter-associated beta strand protein